MADASGPLWGDDKLSEVYLLEISGKESKQTQVHGVFRTPEAAKRKTDKAFASLQWKQKYAGIVWSAELPDRVITVTKWTIED